jgi:microcystin-dependent protein
MPQPFLGQMMMFCGNFPPKGFAFCNGQLLPIAQNTALFSLLGTNYGGNGTQTFALPNLQGNVPVHMGQGPGLSRYVIGETGGTQNVTVLAVEMPAHSHIFNASTVSANSPSPSGRVPAKPTAANAAAYAVSQSAPYPALAPQVMNLQSCSIVGGSVAHNNMMPTLFINFVIALVGVFPARN